MDVMAPEPLTLPRTGLTVADLDRLPEDGAHRYEIVDGVLLVNPTPRQRHQLAAHDLARILEAACPPELVVLAAPQDLRSGPSTSVQPDLLVLRHDNVDLDDNVARSPLLVVEIVSPSSRLVDLHLKRAVYAEIGVPSYWVVDPAEDWAIAYELRGSEYVEIRRAAADEAVDVTKPFPVTFRPTDLLARFR